jgi:hypothetical protein
LNFHVGGEDSDDADDVVGGGGRSLKAIRPALLVSWLGLGFENLDGRAVPGPDGLPRGHAQNERRTAGRPQVDKENIGNGSGTARNPAHHALAETGIKTVIEHDQIGDAGRLHGDHRGGGRGMGNAKGGRQGAEGNPERDLAGARGRLNWREMRHSKLALRHRRWA